MYSVLNAQLIHKSKTTSNASVILDSPTTAIPVLSALLVLSGVLKPISASTSVVRIQPSLNQQVPVSAILASVYLEDSAKLAPITTSSPMGTVLHAQSTPPSIHPLRTVTV